MNGQILHAEDTGAVTEFPGMLLPADWRVTWASVSYPQHYAVTSSRPELSHGRAPALPVHLNGDLPKMGVAKDSKSPCESIVDLPEHLICLIYSFAPASRIVHTRVCRWWLQTLSARNEDISVRPILRIGTRSASCEDEESRQESTVRFLRRFSSCRIHLEAQWNLPAVFPLLLALRTGLNSIVYLDLTGVHLAAPPYTELIPTLSLCSVLESLQLSHTVVDSTFPEAMRCALPRWPALASFSLAGAISAGGEDLGSLLRGWPASAPSAGLTALNLSWLSLGRFGGAALATALRQMPRMLHLNFSACQIDAIGGRHVAAALDSCPALRSLTLDGNCAAAAAAIASAAARSCSALEDLSVGGCGLGDAGAAALEPALARLPSLTRLTVSRNGLSPAGVAAVLAALRSAPAPSHPAPPCRVDARCNYPRAAGPPPEVGPGEAARREIQLLA